MGSYPIGILAFGYDLGGPEHGWKVHEWDDGSYRLKVPWYDDKESFADQVETLLLESVGFTEEWNSTEGYHRRKLVAEKLIKVELVNYGSYDFPGYILALKGCVLKSPDWGSTPVGYNHVHFELREYLQSALNVLGLHPNASGPDWHLATFYG